MNEIFKEIQNERERQNEEWGEQNHSPIEWIAILTEEVGEASKEVVDYHFKNDLTLRAGEDYLKDKVVQKQRLMNYRKELIQVAAVAVQMIECLDRDKQKTNSCEIRIF